MLSGPPSAPLNLGGGSCPASLTNIDNCTWGSGTGAMLGPNSVGVPCSHNEDLWVTCPIASLFDVPPIEFRLIPLQGLNSTARTGSLEGRMAGTTMDWGQIVTADPSSFVTDSTGCAQNLCSLLYPDELEQQLARSRCRAAWPPSPAARWRPGVPALNTRASSTATSDHRLTSSVTQYGQGTRMPPSTSSG